MSKDELECDPMGDDPGVRLSVDKSWGLVDSVIAAGFTASGASVEHATRVRGNVDIGVRYFRISGRIRRGFEALEPPLSHDDLPSVQLKNWFLDIASYLRYLGLESGQVGFSLVLAAPDETNEPSVARLPSSDVGTRVLALNPSPQAMLVRLELTRILGGARRRISVSMPLEAHSGVVVEPAGWTLEWSAAGGPSSAIALVTATV